MIGRCGLPSRNSSRTLTFAPARPAMHIRGLAQGVECFAKGRISIRGLAFAARLLEYTILATLKNRPCQANRSEAVKIPSPTKITPHKPNVAAKRQDFFLGKKIGFFVQPQEVESRVKAGKTRRRQTRHLSIFRASKICFLLAASLSIANT